ncbi:hypothetical protein [Flagellimonas sp. CMM7]|uniref:hypothetical protein n=1 Tax=Flagellimonas sp. CMM7 TaxID=2654676 RepID=UPI0013D6E792|nr:hypothetical protein [Flagellimonas sp. CMM7]UII79561.1 hypothetical protein LV704_18110 [Flagellimonas sp. CMM7]
MNDTVRVRIHGCNDKVGTTKSEWAKKNKGLSDFLVPEHNQLYIKLLQYEGKYFHAKGIGIEEVEQYSNEDTEDWIHKMTNRKIAKHGFQSGMMLFVDETKVKRYYQKVTGNYRVPSSFGGVVFQVNKNAGYIDFEFSIPKYLYGHSLCEFVPQPKSRTAMKEFQRIYDLDFQLSLAYDRFMKFLDKFFLDLCHMFELDTLLNNKYIEVRRLDFCKNQYFKDKEISLDYLSHLNSINIRRYKNNAKITKEYGTGLSYSKADGSYFKIYHKGTEYIKADGGDLKKHEHINADYIASQELDKKIAAVYTENKNFIKYLFNKRTKGEDVVIDPDLRKRLKETVNEVYKMQPFKTDFLKSEMDKILRYESSFRTSYFTQVYKRGIFRRKDRMHRMSMIKYNETKKKYDSRYLEFGEKVVFKEKRNHDMMNGYLNRDCHFMLETNVMIKNYEQKSYMNYDATKDYYKIEPYRLNGTILQGKDIGTFSKQLFIELYKSFFTEVKYYQVKDVSNFDDLLTKVRKYNINAVENARKYNESNSHLVRNYNASLPVINGLKVGKVVKHATDLLKQSEILEKGFKKVSVMQITTILKLMDDDGLSLKQVFVKLGFTANQRSRWRKELKIFGVFDQTIMRAKKVDTRLDFRDYYQNAGHRNKINDWFVNKEFQRYG